MYGYIRPVRDELKIREYEQFRGVYCGLCHSLRKRYGPMLRFSVSYDLTFLAMLLAGSSKQANETCLRRCPYHPFRRTRCPCGFPGLDTAADHSVILTYGKISDEIRDHNAFRVIPWKIAAALIRSPYRRASGISPAFAATVESGLNELVRLEKEKTGNIDAAADAFAGILREACGDREDPDEGRILRELLYHIGRIIYILDAVDDLADDIRRDAYNPLCFRFSVSDGALAKEDEETIRMTLTHSHNSICSAYALLERGPYSNILDNIIYFGLPAAVEAVFSGNWKASTKRFRGRNRL